MNKMFSADQRFLLQPYAVQLFVPGIFALMAYSFKIFTACFACQVQKRLFRTYK